MLLCRDPLRTWPISYLLKGDVSKEKIEDSLGRHLQERTENFVETMLRTLAEGSYLGEQEDEVSDL